MCGIAGIINFSGSTNALNINILKKMSDIIVHRGPDDEGHWISDDNKCGLAFRRLAIVDLSYDGHQPMKTADGRFTIVFNGEIYNHIELREDLEKKGYKYKSKTDTESILYGYQEYGAAFLEKMRGMWDLAIWDRDKKELFCSRDRIGIKPLYYAFQNGSFIFGSEIKSILQHPQISAEMNVNELPNYLCNSMTSAYSTLFKGIHKLQAGTFLLLKDGEEPIIKRYWSPLKENQAYTEMNDKEIQEHTISLLRTAVKDRMMSDVPFGAFLSGGIDSSLTVALMSEMMSRPVDCFSIGFKELEKYNELEYARKVAKLYNANYEETMIDHKDALDEFDKIIWHQDEPNGDPVCIPLYFLSKMTRKKGTIVVLNGEGSDEQFVGYRWMLRDWNFYNSYFKYFSAMPNFLKKSSYNAVKPFFKQSGQLLALDYLRRGAFDDNFYMSGVPVFTEEHLKFILNEKHSNLAKIPSQYTSKLYQLADSLNSKADPLQRWIFMEFAQRLPELLLMRVDKITMASSLEARVPFLDHRFVEFTFSLPISKKIPNKTYTKAILKEAARGVIPDEIIDRRKQGFWAPVTEWFRKDWKGMVESEFHNSPLLNSDLFDKKQIFKLLEIHQSGKVNLGKEIYNLLALSVWHRQYIS